MSLDSRMPYEIANASAEIKSHYRKMVEDGQTPRWAEMCALQCPPGTKGTDRAFQEGRLDGNWLDELPLRQAKRIVRQARQAGISIEGKQYVSGLANKLGHCDPEAWVSDLSDIRRVAKARNLEVRGIVDIDSRPQEGPPTKVGLNKSITKELAKKAMAAQPGLAMKDAVAAVTAKHMPHWKAGRT